MKSVVLSVCLAFVAAACTGGGGVATSVVTLAPDPVTTTGLSTVPPATATPPPGTSTAPPPTPSTSTTAGPPVCPDLGRDEGPDSEIQDVVLTAWERGTGDKVWEMDLGTRMPSWGVGENEVVLGFRDGQLAGIPIATCDAWVLAAVERLSEVVVTEGGAIVVVGDGELAGYSGRGFASWRQATDGETWRAAADNAGVTVLIDRTGDLLGIDSNSGETVFEWDNTSGTDVTVAAGETFLYRAALGSVTARPVGGGGIVWDVPLDDVTALFAVPGTLLAVAGETLVALEPSDGAIRWSVSKPFEEPVVGPVVLDHQELHLAAGTSGVWHLDPADGSVVFEGRPPPGTEWFPEMDDALVLEIGGDGTVVAVDMLERNPWTLETGADRLGRFTLAEVTGSYIVTLTFTAERF